MPNMRPGVLMLGEVHHAHQQFDELVNISDLKQVNGGTRAVFLKDCSSGLYDGIVAISRTYDSTKFTGPFDADLISQLPRSVSFICHNGAGYETVDVQACSERGIQVSNTPDVVNEATADTAMFLILGALRRIWGIESALRHEGWSKFVSLGRDPKNLVLGILGMGGIGRATAIRASAFGFQLQYHNRKPISNLESILPAAFDVPLKYVSFEELIKTSDVISVHLPLSAETRGAIGAKEIEAMKQDVIIVNTARGPVIDEDALVKGLDSGKIWSVGLDVFEKEPKVHPGLLQSHKAVLLPHIGTATVDTRRTMENLVIENLKRAITQGRLVTPVLGSKP